MRYLHFVANLSAAPYRTFVRRLAHALEVTGARRLIDLCSGATGPLPTVLRLLDAEGVTATAVLTDRFPDPDAEGPSDRITVHPHPVDARAVPPELGGFRLLCNSFHHFTPDDARRILADAVQQRVGIALVELVDRRWLSVAAAGFGLLGVPLVLPFLRPWRWDHAVLTYLLPLIPLMTAFDGVVSALRVYSPDELRTLVTGADPDATFTWTIERTPLWGLPVGSTWLVGYPRNEPSRST